LIRAIRLLLAYDGTDFCGWQSQGAGGRSVQGCLEGALAAMHRRPVGVTGAGRTDAGVHAAGQVAGFRTDIKNMDAGRFVPALNSLLPRDARVLEARETIPDFHARFDARERTYQYHFICGRQALPHESRYALSLRRRPRIALLNSYCRILRGEMDCSLFAGAGDSSKTRVRRISRAIFYARGDRLVFEISANAFLLRMARSVAGTLLRHEEIGAPPELFREAVESRDRARSGPTLPPRGLFLWKVDYSRGESAAGLSSVSMRN